MRAEYFIDTWLEQIYGFSTAARGGDYRWMKRDRYMSQMGNLYWRYLDKVEENMGVWGFSIGVSANCHAGISKNLVFLFNNKGDFSIHENYGVSAGVSYGIDGSASFFYTDDTSYIDDFEGWTYDIVKVGGGFKVIHNKALSVINTDDGRTIHVKTHELGAGVGIGISTGANRSKPILDIRDGRITYVDETEIYELLVPVVDMPKDILEGIFGDMKKKE